MTFGVGPIFQMTASLEQIKRAFTPLINIPHSSSDQKNSFTLQLLFVSAHKCHMKGVLEGSVIISVDIWKGKGVKRENIQLLFSIPFSSFLFSKLSLRRIYEYGYGFKLNINTLLLCTSTWEVKVQMIAKTGCYPWMSQAAYICPQYIWSKSSCFHS